MFHTNAFGQRVNCNPYLRFANDNGGKGGGGSEKDDKSKKDEQQKQEPEEKGFPAETPVSEMKPAEQAAYWKDKARKHETESKRKADYDDLKAKADRLEELEAKNLSDHEKELKEAREKSRLEGETIGSERYLKDAVKARFQALTQKTDEEVETAFAHVDAGSFRDDKGDIDLDALKTFAATFGKSDRQQDTKKDPVREAIERRRAAGGGTGSSISEKRKEVRESMTKPKA